MQDKHAMGDSIALAILFTDEVLNMLGATHV
jgi:hypothetical protein